MVVIDSDYFLFAVGGGTRSGSFVHTIVESTRCRNATNTCTATGGRSLARRNSCILLFEMNQNIDAEVNCVFIPIENKTTVV
jgi:hypothetical protein